MSYTLEHYTGVLKAFAQAFDRLDADGLVALMTDDCVFRTAGGAQAGGNAIVGKAAVHAAFVQIFANFPDSQWLPRNINAVWQEGDTVRGVSEWTYVATRAADGAKLNMDGVDMFTLRDGKIAVKDAFRKDVPPVLKAN
jgi:ketosteroid isomerase-like protein